MKIKLSWIPFIPITLLSVFLRAYQVVYVNSGVDQGFLNNETIWVIYAAMIALLFVVLAIFTAADRKTSGFYDISKNFFAGIFSFIAGIALIGGCAQEVISVLNGSLGAAVLVDALFSVLAGAAFIIMGVSSLSGKIKGKKLKVLMLFPPVWGCIRLIYTFMNYTKSSIHSFDMTNVIFMAFGTLFLFNVAMIYAGVKTRNPVKAVFLYGMPMIAVTLTYCAAIAVTKIVTDGEIVDILAQNQGMGLEGITLVQFFFVSLFALFFLIELTSKAKKKDVQLDKIEETHLRGVTKKDEIDELPVKTNKFADAALEVENEVDQIDDAIQSIDEEKKDVNKEQPFASEPKRDSIDDELDAINRLISELENEEK